MSEKEICERCEKEKKIKARGMCANCYRLELAEEKKSEGRRALRMPKTKKAPKNLNLLKKAFSDINKLTKELIKENIGLSKDNKYALKKTLVVRKNLLRACHQNKQLREHISEIQEKETAELANLDVASK